jgi:hypothetical protein
MTTPYQISDYLQLPKDRIVGLRYLDDLAKVVPTLQVHRSFQVKRCQCTIFLQEIFFGIINVQTVKLVLKLFAESLCMTSQVKVELKLSISQISIP